MQQDQLTQISQNTYYYSSGTVNDHLGVKYIQYGIHDPGFTNGLNPNGGTNVMDGSGTGGNVVLFLKGNLFLNIPPPQGGVTNGPGIAEIFLAPNFNDIPTNSTFYKYTPPGTSGSNVYGAPSWVPAPSTSASISLQTSATSPASWRDNLYQIPTTEPTTPTGSNVFFYIFS